LERIGKKIEWLRKKMRKNGRIGEGNRIEGEG
jgi:hypothetical protein